MGRDSDVSEKVSKCVFGSESKYGLSASIVDITLGKFES